MLHYNLPKTTVDYVCLSVCCVLWVQESDVKASTIGVGIKWGVFYSNTNANTQHQTWHSAVRNWDQQFDYFWVSLNGKTQEKLRFAKNRPLCTRNASLYSMTKCIFSAHLSNHHRSLMLWHVRRCMIYDERTHIIWEILMLVLTIMYAKCTIWDCLYKFSRFRKTENRTSGKFNL